MPLKRCAILAAAGCLVSSCSTLLPQHSPADLFPVLSRIRANGEMVVAMSGEQPPLNTTDPSGAVIGLEPDIARLLADSLGVELRIVTKPFSELLLTLERGEADAVISGVTITPERNMRHAFVGPYFVSGKSVLAKAKTIKRLDEMRELNEPATRLAVLAGSTSEIFVSEVLPRAQMASVAAYEEGVQGILDGTFDALIADFPFCVLAVLKYPQAQLVTLSEPFTFEPLGIALPANDPLFLNLVENFLVTMEGTGRLLEMKAHWFSDGPWLENMEKMERKLRRPRAPHQSAGSPRVDRSPLPG
jgi:polar amino acid transport system substrate-binding protein